MQRRKEKTQTRLPAGGEYLATFVFYLLLCVKPVQKSLISDKLNILSQETFNL
jgi:hypothetical protein